MMTMQQLGSFGAITRITNIIRNRSGLLRLAAAGPLAGAFFGLTIILIGLLLPPGEGQGIVVDAGAFHDSLLVGGLGKWTFLNCLLLRISVS